MTISRAGARHDMRDAVPPCEMRYRGEAGTGCRNRSRRPTRRSRRTQRPQRTRGRLGRAITAGPRAPTPSTTPRVASGRRTRTPSRQPSGRGGPARADRHHNLHTPRLQNHPLNNLPAVDERMVNDVGRAIDRGHRRRRNLQQRRARDPQPHAP